MSDERKRLPESPTEIALETGMCAPGLVEGADLTEAVPGQSGAEALAELPNAGPDDPNDGP